MAAASSVIPDRLRSNAPSFVFLDLLIDEDFDEWSFTDLTFSFRHNYTIQYLTLIRSESKEERRKQSMTNPQKRTTEEIRMLIEEVVQLPKLKRLDLENFEEDELDELKDLWQSTQRSSVDICSMVATST